MGCCCGTNKVEDTKPLIIDVQKVIEDIVWNRFIASTGTFRRRFIRRKDYTVEVPMNYYLFEKTKQEFFTRDRLSGTAQPSKTELKELTTKGHTHPDRYELQTEFKNDTDAEQEYNFVFSKERRATVHVTYHKGFSIGTKANFSIGLPKLLADGSVSGEVSTNFEVSKTSGETFEESLTTSATSRITVSAHSNYVASVVMEESSFLADFKVYVTMSMPGKEARAYVKNKQGETVGFQKIVNLARMFPNNVILDGPDGNRRIDAVQFVIEGVVEGVQLANHKINLKGEKIIKQAEEGVKSASVKKSVKEEADGEPSVHKDTQVVSTKR